MSTLRELAGEAWREVLHCTGPADDDNFFDLGGRSLTGAQVLGLLQPHVQTKLSIRVLFDHPVFHEFAAAISHLGENRA
ncbi:phosphopantetheine-binding protein [Kibdelosporangium lantanae]|uniref:Phosphopantetheine-binding protein n=1 Tax=Kibdelosporangium lantanae TaxID=1497396 RepID=A0ABW3MD23_9PSEU